VPELVFDISLSKCKLAELNNVTGPTGEALDADKPAQSGGCRVCVMQLKYPHYSSPVISQNIVCHRFLLIAPSSA